MNITGIITEYNPFHLGHLHHLHNCKKDTNSDGIICIMSGNFVQRGLPAMIDKWKRAEIAVKNGVDLVIELPLIYSVASAEFFAEGAVKILNSTSVVNNIYFGSEHGNIDDLYKIANLLCNEDIVFKNYIKIELNKGLPFHTARENALNKVMPNFNSKNILNNSNNILAIEYIKALIKLKSNMKPLTLKRLGANYNEKDLSSSFSSATSIRNFLNTTKNITPLINALPNETFNILNELNNNNYKFIFSEDIFPYLKYKILTEGSYLKHLMDVTEGIDNKIIKEIVNSNSLNELIMNIKSKRYTYTRINRILTSFFIGLEKYNISNLIKETPTYIRPLAFNKTGSLILKEIKKKDNIKIITKISKENNNPILDLDILGTKSYSILNNNISPIDDYLKSPKVIE